MEERLVKLYSTRGTNLALHMIPGHFATSHSHINAYIDLNGLKTRAGEAKQVAENLASDYLRNSDVIDTIVCMDGTEMIGAFLAEEFENRGFYTNNQHQTIYVISPEYNASRQMVFRDNNVNAIRNRQVLLLLSTTTTGQTVRRAMECVHYYGGKVQGISSIFSTVDEVDGQAVHYVFNADDIPGYMTYARNQCPFCKKGIPLEAMVNSYGYSKF